MKKVLVFGTFDVFHDGHRHFLAEAKKLAYSLTVALATDNVVKDMKGSMPKNAYLERKNVLIKSGAVDEVVESDKTIGTWNILSRVLPDVIAIGYDQIDLYNSVTKYISDLHKNIDVIRITPFSNTNLHSSSIKNG